MNIIISGPPASGKSLLAQVMKKMHKNPVTLFDHQIHSRLSIPNNIDLVIVEECRSFENILLMVQQFKKASRSLIFITQRYIPSIQRTRGFEIIHLQGFLNPDKTQHP